MNDNGHSRLIKLD